MAHIRQNLPVRAILLLHHHILRTMSTPSPDHSARDVLAALTPALDSFDFDAAMDRAILGAEHAASDGPSAFEYLSTASPAGGQASTSSPHRRPVMMGDYTEKLSFLPSTSLIRNEILEAFDVAGGGTPARDAGGARPVGFRCVHCRHAEGRSGCAEFRPRVSTDSQRALTLSSNRLTFRSRTFHPPTLANGRNVFGRREQTLASIHGSFVRFQNGHFLTCHLVPREIRKTFEKMTQQERAVGFAVESSHDASVFLHSAVRRGFRDAPSGEGGIVHSPAFALEDLDARERRATDGIESPLDADVIVPGQALLNPHPGNRAWKDLVLGHRAEYEARPYGTKGEVARRIVAAVRAASGRFLIRDEGTGLWRDIGDEKARVRTVSALQPLDSDFCAKTHTVVFHPSARRSGTSRTSGRWSWSVRRSPPSRARGSRSSARRPRRARRSRGRRGPSASLARRSQARRRRRAGGGRSGRRSP